MEKIGEWTLQELAYISPNNLKMYVARHICGYETIASRMVLERGKTCYGCGSRKKRNSQKSKANICFDCENALGGCSWSKDFTPVEGWTAEKVFRWGNTTENGKRIAVMEETGYHITKCPLFERTPTRKERKEQEEEL